MFKIATWNVNSLRVRMQHVLDWLDREKPDVLALQEIKMTDETFPVLEFAEAGYLATYSGQKTYNGVATLSKTAQEIVTKAVPGFPDPQKRVLGTMTRDIFILNLYVPNGSEVGSDKYRYKLDWLSHLNAYTGDALKQYKHCILLGDFNIAPADEDVHDPEEWAGKVLCSEDERSAFFDLTACGLTDCFRLFEQESGSFSWWDYRAAAFRRNRGLRIDHILASKPLAGSCHSCRIDKAPRKLERPSDHAPVIAEFEL
jgi:exodeoxyribonuclease-3